MDMRTRGAIDVALTVLGTAGLVGITIAAPNALQGLQLILKKSPVQKARYTRLLKELKRQGLIYITESGGEIHYTLTPAGVYRLQQNIVDNLEISRPSRWDKKWRLIVFDIPVKQSRQRSAFVSHLQNMGFVMLQKSLWIHPFPCFEQVEQLAGHYNVFRHCNLMEIDKLDELAARKLLRAFDNLLHG